MQLLKASQAKKKVSKMCCVDMKEKFIAHKDKYLIQ